MKTLIDNTALNRINKAIKNTDATTPIRVIEVLALFQFSEHIMFSENIEVSSF